MVSLAGLAIGAVTANGILEVGREGVENLVGHGG